MKIGYNSLKWRLSLVALSIVICLTTIDTAIVNTALPVIANDLNSSDSSAVWAINSYQLAMISFMLPLAALGDCIGYKKIYVSGLIIFIFSSLLCGLSGTLSALIISRGLQGLGAAAIMSVNTAIIKFIYPPNKIGQGLGFNALIVAISFTIAPTISTSILIVANWNWLFYVNIPIGFLALILSVYFIPSNYDKSIHSLHNSFDWLSSFLCIIFFSTFILGLGELAQGGSLIMLLCEWLTTSIMLLLLISREKQSPKPILAIDIIKSLNTALPALTSICTFIVQGLSFVSLPFVFLNVFHMSLLETGLFITPWPLFVAIIAPIAGRLSDNYKCEILSGVGLFVLMSGMFSLAMLNSSTSTLNLLVYMGICGIGFGLFQTPNLRAIMTSVSASRSGSASGIVAISRLLGQTIGAALVAMAIKLFPGEGIKITLWLGGLFALLGVIICIIRWYIGLAKDSLQEI